MSEGACLLMLHRRLANAPPEIVKLDSATACFVLKCKPMIKTGTSTPPPPIPPPAARKSDTMTNKKLKNSRVVIGSKGGGK